MSGPVGADVSLVVTDPTASVSDMVSALPQQAAWQPFRSEAVSKTAWKPDQAKYPQRPGGARQPLGDRDRPQGGSRTVFGAVQRGAPQARHPARLSPYGRGP